MSRTHHAMVWAFAAATLALSACSDQNVQNPPPPPAVGSETRTPAAPAPAPAPMPPEQTLGGDGSQIQLSALTSADMQANPIQGELACSFAANGETLLIAQGNVASKDAAQGLVKVTGYVERIAAPGGFDGMLKGANFTGAGKTILIAVDGPATGGGESPPSPATLTYQRADGASRVIPGTWTCGP
ncbi:MAG: hypothetical protein B7Z44_01400 [Caulobacter sp. 12-67-6]|nr:MAG: hypothetical protein B7Z44_01400 [Caulobacter sp. 12-67-6]OYX70901.1 MAG: hypothetical protein B7Y81_10465 [Caulobacter sp. 32-67-35]